MFTLAKKPNLSIGSASAKTTLVKPPGMSLALSTKGGRSVSPDMPQVRRRDLPPALPDSNFHFNFAWIPATPLQAQRKPAVSTQQDSYEREADDVADKLSRLPNSESFGSPAVAIQRECTHCDDEENAPIQATRAPFTEHGSTAEMSNPRHDVSQRGTLLQSEVREFFESRFRHDFSSVRVHTDKEAAEAAQAMQARAYTIGSHIVFGYGEYAPTPEDGKRLIAHELTHVVQQQSHSSAALDVPQRQRRTPRRQEPAASSMAPPDRIEAFFAQNSTIMRSLNPHRSAVNCPATAAAVDEYLGTGVINPAPGGSPRSVFAFAQQWAPVGNLTTLLRQPGSYASVRGTRSEDYANLQGITREHYFVVVNRGGTLWVLDAYNHTRMPIDQFLARDQFQTIEYFRGPFRVTHISNPPPGAGRP